MTVVYVYVTTKRLISYRETILGKQRVKLRRHIVFRFESVLWVNAL